MYDFLSLVDVHTHCDDDGVITGIDLKFKNKNPEFQNMHTVIGSVIYREAAQCELIDKKNFSIGYNESRPEIYDLSIKLDSCHHLSHTDIGTFIDYIVDSVKSCNIPF